MHRSAGFVLLACLAGYSYNWEQWTTSADVDQFNVQNFPAALYSSVYIQLPTQDDKARGVQVFGGTWRGHGWEVPLIVVNGRKEKIACCEGFCVLLKHAWIVHWTLKSVSKSSRATPPWSWQDCPSDWSAPDRHRQRGRRVLRCWVGYGSGWFCTDAARGYGWVGDTESDSESLLSQYKFTRKCVLRRTVGNRINNRLIF